MQEKLIQVAQLEQVKPGKMLAVTVDSYDILLANVDGTIYAVDDLCPHEDTPLSTGSLHDDCVKCPLHGSRFDLKTGEPLEEPAEEAIKTYPVTIQDNIIFIQLT